MLCIILSCFQLYHNYFKLHRYVLSVWWEWIVPADAMLHGTGKLFQRFIILIMKTFVCRLEVVWSVSAQCTMVPSGSWRSLYGKQSSLWTIGAMHNFESFSHVPSCCSIYIFKALELMNHHVWSYSLLFKVLSEVQV